MDIEKKTPMRSAPQSSVGRVTVSLLFFLALLVVIVDLDLFFGTVNAFRIGVGIITSFLIIQAVFNLLTMIFSWNDPHTLADRSFPATFSAPKTSFTALIPVRDEAAVIKQTLKAIDRIEYPDQLKEIIVICRADDKETIAHAIHGCKWLHSEKLQILVSHKDIPNKPASLNLGRRYASGDVIVVFDAEDEPNKDIYSVVNSVFVQENVDVVQAGVQLMNFRSTWYAVLSCLEYYFWFKSSLHAFSHHGVVPLGGNTVFLKKMWLEKIGGWDETKLTEDADIGIRLSAAGAKIRVVYDERHATREEVPPTLSAFVKQRSRWNQGFYQIFLAGEWMGLSGVWRKFLTVYLLLVPLLQLLWFLYIPLMIFLLFTGQVPVLLALFSFIPAYVLVLQVTIFVLGLYDFARAYHLHLPFWYPLKLAFVFFPYQLILAWSSLRGILRLILSHNGWEKTEHFNFHRSAIV
ncbi:MAG: glycosyltransferase [Candidatus Woesebacteria bacterium]